MSLPRFSLAETYKLREILISLGMKDAFNVATSDFTGETVVPSYFSVIQSKRLSEAAGNTTFF